MPTRKKQEKWHMKVDNNEIELLINVTNHKDKKYKY